VFLSSSEAGIHSATDIHFEQISMSTTENVKKLLAQTLQLGSRADTLTADSALLGALPELDSMAVVTILTAMEDYFGFTVDDDEISADTFETFGSLVAFVDAKLAA
jgi:acyl carrier protein